MEISYIETETKSEFIRMLKKKNFNKLILGEEQEGNNKYYVFQPKNNDEISFVLGIICMNNGLKPEAVWVNNKLFLGFNHIVYIIDISNSEYKKIKMDSLFYEFIINKENKKIIGVFELDILCLDFDGYRCWTYSAGDIISECHIEKDILFIAMLYESCQKVSLSTGKRLN